MDMSLNRRDIGYTVVSRFEEAFRSFLGNELSVHFTNYQEGIPNGVIKKAQERSTDADWQDAVDFLESTDFPDLVDICLFKNMYEIYFSHEDLSQTSFTEIMISVYESRNRIAHVKQHFSAFDLDRLLEGTRKIAKQLGEFGSEFLEFIRILEQNPSSVVIPMPVSFSDSYREPYSIPNNLPAPDYELEGGFVGRKEDIRKLTGLLEGTRNVITIAGAGGVGKTALALRTVQLLMQRRDRLFDAIVWLSAKETKLSYLGIEDIEPSVKNYEELLDTVFEVAGFENPSESLEQKESDVSTVIQLFPRTLIIVDNLETITDSRITNFILDVEDKFPTVKVLITSRKGLGQVERRHDLRQLQVKEAVNLFRRIARDKQLGGLAQLDQETLEYYVNRVACYPLAIKWVIGQTAIGKNINDVIQAISETTSDISKFSFEQVYGSLSITAKKILCALSVFDEAPSAGILHYIVDTSKDEIEDGLQELIL